MTGTAYHLKGPNASAWKSGLLAVGGMDERFASGSQDRELGVRLQNHGIKPRHVRFDAVGLHLDRARGYRTDAMVREVREHRQRIECEGTAYTAHRPDALLAAGYPASLESEGSETTGASGGPGGELGGGLGGGA